MVHNKMTLKNFLNAGGVVEVRLVRDLWGIGMKQLWFAAGSVESAGEMADSLQEAENRIREFFRYGRSISIDNFIESIVFRWHGWSYAPEHRWPSVITALRVLPKLEDSNDIIHIHQPEVYLYAKERIYGN